MNLYGFVQNDGVNKWDYLGLVVHRIEVIKNTGGIIASVWGFIGDYGQPGHAAHGIVGGDMVNTVVSGVALVGAENDKTYCNTVINQTSTDASAVMIYSKAENMCEAGSKYRIYFRVRIQGVTVIDSAAGEPKGMPGVTYNVNATNGGTLSKTIDKNDSFDESRILVATVCLSEKETRTLTTTVSITSTGKGRATGQQMVEIITSEYVGKCDN